MNERGVDALGSDIVRIQRKARFADTDNLEWGGRLVRLIEAQPGLSDAIVTNVHQVGTAAGGSNGTLLFDARWSDAGEEQGRSLVVRFLPEKGLFHRYSVEEQFKLQRALGDTSVPVPRQVWLDAGGEYLVRPGYVMERVEGQSPPMAWRASGIVADASPKDRRAILTSYLDSLVKLHAVNWRDMDLEWLTKRAAGSGFIEREVNWYWDALIWSGRESYLTLLRPVREWLIANEPGDIEPVICHGDANLGNYMYRGTEVTAIVDWEMAFLGTPECDVTFMMLGDQILQGEIALDGVPEYDERKAIYERLSGRTLRNMPYFELFSAYRLAVINVLAMNHFPPDVLKEFMPVLTRGPQIALVLARKLGVPVVERSPEDEPS